MESRSSVVDLTKQEKYILMRNRVPCLILDDVCSSEVTHTCICDLFYVLFHKPSVKFVIIVLFIHVFTS